MLKNRSSIYTVIREKEVFVPYEYHGYTFDAVIGVYTTAEGADWAKGEAEQAFKDAGVDDGAYKFSVQISTYYDA